MLEEVTKIMRGEPSEGAEGHDSDAGEGSEGAAKASPKTLEDLAKSAGLEVDALYDLAIPIGEGDQAKTLTLGEIKDIAKQASDLTVRGLELDESHAKRTADLMRDRGELQELFALLPETARTDELREKARNIFEAKAKAERRRAREAIDGWDDDQKRLEDLEGMVEHLEGYGFEKTYLMGVLDHRMVNYIRESWQREKRMTEAMERVKQLRAAGSKPAPAAAPAPRRSSANGASRGRAGQRETVSRVASLLNEAGF